MTRALVATVLVSLWMGAALLTVTVVAPGAFAVLPTRALAGDLVGRVLPVVFIGAIIIPLAALGITPAARRSVAGVAAGALSVLAAAAALLGVNPRIAAVRAAAAVPIDQLMPDDPRRALFGLLHVVSVALLVVAILALAFLLVTLARATVARDDLSGDAR